MPSFSVLTLGCKVNSYESEAVISNLIDHGFVFKNFNDICDVYIINTCTVTQTSDQKSRQMIHKARRLNKDAVIVAMGCYSQLNQDEALSMADIVIGNNNKMNLYSLIDSYLKTKEQITEVVDLMDKPIYEEMKVSKLLTHTRGFIKIQDGCENYCSYCAIPYSRGKIRSRNADNIIDEIKELVLNGTKEIILSGINTGAYGKDLNNYNLAKLIERIMEETSIYRVRISSIELMEISDELLDVIKNYPDRIAHHFHVPAQAGVDSVLKRMHRKYDIKTYEERIQRIRNIFPDVAISTDLLAGFVGETEEEFQSLKEFMYRINYSFIHVFPYSKRKGTEAYLMNGHLDKKVQEERCHELINIGNELTDKFIKSNLNKEFDIIVENKKNDYYHGHSSNYLDIYFKSDKSLVNEIVKVKALNYIDGVIYGEMEE